LVWFRVDSCDFVDRPPVKTLLKKQDVGFLLHRGEKQTAERPREILLLINNFAIDNRHHALRLQYFQLRNCHDVG